ncbi:MAG: hypothetical protein ACFFD4_36445 [Candidatus Odinarchaeota archaeon]
MTTSILDSIMRRALNDPAIFSVRYAIFNEAEWAGMKKSWKKFRKQDNKEDHDKLQEKINQRLAGIDKEINVLKSKRKPDRRDRANMWALEQSKELANALKAGLTAKPYTVDELFSKLDRFGLIRCNLPKRSSMEDFGKVIENKSQAIAKEYFLEKMARTKDRRQKQALQRIFDYVMELYSYNYPVDELAYFVRKIHSLEGYIQVIKDE